MLALRAQAEHVHNASRVRLTNPPFSNCCRLYFLRLRALQIWTGQGPSQRKVRARSFPVSVTERLGEKFVSPAGPQQPGGRRLERSSPVPVKIESPEGRTTFGPGRRVRPSADAVRRVDVAGGVGWWGHSRSPDPTCSCYSFTASERYWA
jgi:hypothetical protein